MNKTQIRLAATIAIMLMMVMDSYSQGHFVSTYSNIGLGKMRNTTSKRYEAMGGLGIGVRSNRSISPLNPASYGGIDSLSFMFDIGASYSIYDVRSGSNKTDAMQGNIDYLYLGFPITKWMKASAGFYPVSSVGYNVVSNSKDDVWGNKTHMYVGTGGVNSYYVGLGFNFAKILSLGFNFSYIGGTIKKSQNMQFSDSLYVFDAQIRNKMSVDNVWFNFGFQAAPILKNGDRMVFGLTLTPQMSIKTRNELLFRSMTYNASGVEVIRDTVFNRTNNNSKITMPMRIGAGFSYERPDFFTVGVDVEWVNWDKYKVEEVGAVLSNTFRGSIGFEIIPNIKNRKQYFSRMMYRAGFHANQNYLEIEGNKIMEFGGSIGLGFPIRRLTTAVNLGFEIGTMGSMKDGLVRETYYKVSLGVSLSEKWFEKRRIN